MALDKNRFVVLARGGCMRIALTKLLLTLMMNNTSAHFACVI